MYQLRRLVLMKQMWLVSLSKGNVVSSSQSQWRIMASMLVSLKISDMASVLVSLSIGGCNGVASLLDEVKEV